jgi:hypothetical protein
VSEERCPQWPLPERTTPPTGKRTAKCVVYPTVRVVIAVRRVILPIAAEKEETVVINRNALVAVHHPANLLGIPNKKPGDSYAEKKAENENFSLHCDLVVGAKNRGDT